MRALRFHAARDLRIEEVTEPPAPSLGDVVVRVATCGICGTDLHEYTAGPIVTPVEPHPLTGAQNPQILGHEFAGDVVATGPGVTSVAEGDRVAIMPLAYCGHCPYCRRGLQHLCAMMACVGLSHPWGGMAELATVAEYQVVRLPESVTYRQGALIEPTAVAAYGVERAGVGPGDSVLVTGAGPIGALNVAVTPHATVATDPYFVPLGAPIYLHKADRHEIDGLWVAQDTGGAIKGPNRFDTFWGAGPEAVAIAGGMSASGEALILLPKGVAARALAQP